MTKASVEASEREPADRERCQTFRPSTWPIMPSFMTLGPVSFKRCDNTPAWLAGDGEGQMSLCDECKVVCEKVMPPGTTFEAVKR